MDQVEQQERRVLACSKEHVGGDGRAPAAFSSSEENIRNMLKGSSEFIVHWSSIVVCKVSWDIFQERGGPGAQTLLLDRKSYFISSRMIFDVVQYFLSYRPSNMQLKIKSVVLGGLGLRNRLCARPYKNNCKYTLASGKNTFFSTKLSMSASILDECPYSVVIKCTENTRKNESEPTYGTEDEFSLDNMAQTEEHLADDSRVKQYLGRQFSCLIHGRLKEKRIPLPACSYHAI